jgi:hypothetical protein
MKRLVPLSMALCFLAIAVPPAQTAPTSDTGCTVEHLSNAACQGPDADPAANACEINTWVGDATCELTIPDGVASHANGFAFAYAQLQNDATWHAEFHYEIRDKDTGQVLFSDDRVVDSPVGEDPDNATPSANFSFGAVFTGGDEVICEITGTHSPAGAAFSAVAATEGFGQLNNRFRCGVA